MKRSFIDLDYGNVPVGVAVTYITFKYYYDHPPIHKLVNEIHHQYAFLAVL